MKRRGFLGLLSALPFVPKVVAAPPALKVPKNEAPAPAYSFTNDTDTGMYRSSTDSIKLSVGGKEIYVPYYSE